MKNGKNNQQPPTKLQISLVENKSAHVLDNISRVTSCQAKPKPDPKAKKKAFSSVFCKKLLLSSKYHLKTLIYESKKRKEKGKINKATT